MRRDHAGHQRKPHSGLFGGNPEPVVRFFCGLRSVVFNAKTSLIEYYKQRLGATTLNNQLMIIHTQAAVQLINTYFHNG